MTILRDFSTLRFWRHFSINCFACLGFLGTILQTINVTDPSITFFQGPITFFCIVVVSLLLGVWRSWPTPITQEYNSPKTRISIVEGNILSQQTHLVIGTTDTFDTETPNIIDTNSLQGQVLHKLYGGDLNRLNTDLDLALASRTGADTIIKPGKQTKYGVGSIATVNHAARLIFFLAYCEMNLNNNASSTPDKVWKSLTSLWEEVSRRGNGNVVSVPVIGGGNARVSNLLPAQDAIRLIILSFMFASRGARVCEELRIVVQREDYQKLDRLELQSFLASLRSS